MQKCVIKEPFRVSGTLAIDMCIERLQGLKAYAEMMKLGRKKEKPCFKIKKAPVLKLIVDNTSCNVTTTTKHC